MTSSDRFHASGETDNSLCFELVPFCVSFSTNVFCEIAIDATVSWSARESILWLSWFTLFWQVFFSSGRYLFLKKCFLSNEVFDFRPFHHLICVTV